MAGILTIVLGTALLIYPLYCLGNTKKIHLLTAEASAAFFMLYILITAVLYGIGKYSLGLAELTTGLSALLLCILSILIFRVKLSFDKIKLTKSSIFTILIIIFCAGLSVSNFEAFGMGQDEGVYQVEAINILYGKSEWRQDLRNFTEDRKIGNDSYKDIAEWYFLGFDTYNQYQKYFDNSIPFLKVEVPNENEDCVGWFHGIPTYPSFLALSAQIFGIGHMAWGNVILLLTTLVLLYEILSFFNTDKTVCNLILLLFGMCPEIVWVNMSTLTESGLVLLIVSFIYYFLVCGKEKKYWISVVSLGAFCVYHVSVYTMIPWFLLLFWGFFICFEKKKYIISSLIMLALYWIGFLFMINMNGRYTVQNYKFGTKFFGEMSPNLVVLVMVIIGMCISLTILILRTLLKEKTDELVKKMVSKEKRNKIIIAVLFGAGLLLIIIKMISGYIEKDNYIPTILAFTLLTGVFVLPTILIKILSGKYKLSRNTLFLVISLFWCVIIFTLVMLPNIKYYYYFGRYLGPYIPVILTAYAFFIKDGKAINKILVSLGLILLIPLQIFIHINKDDSRMDWKVIEDMLEIAGENFDSQTDVYMDLDLITTLYFPLRAGTEADIYITDVKDIIKNVGNKSNSGAYAIVKGDYSDLEQTCYYAKVMTQEDTLNKRIPIVYLPTNYDINPFDISVIDLKALYSEGKLFQFDDSELKVEEAVCDEEGQTTIRVSGILPDDDISYYNDDNFWISYHLISEEGEMLSFDNARYYIGNVSINDEASIDFDIERLISPYDVDMDGFSVEIDLVHEGDRWKSFEDDNLPHISFTKKDNVWKIDKIY